MTAGLEGEHSEQPIDPRLDSCISDYSDQILEHIPDSTLKQRRILAISLANERIRSEDEAAARVAQLQKLAGKDELTGLDNLRTLNEELYRAIAEANRSGKPLSLCFVDIDEFKIVNDTFGHTVGDVVLKAVAKTASRSIRESDRACRYGGEEFIVILPATSTEEAIETADRLRQKIAASKITAQNKPIHVTASIGVSTFVPHDPHARRSTATFDQLIGAADTAMYAAKAAGRDRVGFTDHDGTIYILERGSATLPRPEQTAAIQKP